MTKKNNEIIIADHNLSKIEELINAAQKRCSARTIDLDVIHEAIKDIEQRYLNELRITKKALNGSYFWVDRHSQIFANSYRGIPESTQFGLHYKNGSWRLDYIRRDRTGSRYIGATLSDAAKQSLINNNDHV